MWRIEREDYGYHLTFSGHIKADEMQAWLEASEIELDGHKEPFGVFVDMRHMILLPPESQEAMKEGQRLYRRRGMVRSVVILRDEVVALQFQRIAKESGIYEWERYIDASSEPNWERVGMAWIVEGIDPDSHSNGAYPNLKRRVQSESGKISYTED